jgi:hypothetical protein
MLLPVLMRDSLSHYASFDTEEALFFHLITTEEWFDFFIIAFQDQTWCLSHETFFKKALQFVTKLLLEERLQESFQKEILKALQTQFSGLNPIIPKDLTLLFEEDSCLVNSFLAASSSDFFLFEMKERCAKEGSGTLLIKEKMGVEELELFRAYIEKKESSSLYKLSFERLWEFQKLTHRLDLKGIQEVIAETLKRYIDETNVIFYLKRSISDHFFDMAVCCSEVIDDLGWGLTLKVKRSLFLEVRYESFSDNGIKFYKEFRDKIDEIHVSNNLSQHLFLKEIFLTCPHLKFLSLAGTNGFCPYFTELPQRIEGLDLSMCSWLNDTLLEGIVDQFPNLRTLLIRSNRQLGPLAFRSLLGLKYLKRLDVSRNDHLREEELRLIIRAAPYLEEFILEECVGIAPLGFYELARGYKSLIEVNLSRTLITNPCLIELAERNPHIEELVLDRAVSLTFKGIKEAISHLPFLKRLKIEGCQLTEQERSLLSLLDS